MNDDWSRCPICYEDYSLVHRPTTFGCGHSTCIDHTFGPNSLRECPICRHSLNEQNEYNVSYNLEEASRLYHTIKSTIDYSTIKFPLANTQTSHTSRMHREETYPRRLPAKCDHEVRNDETMTRPQTILALILAAASGLKKRQRANQQQKECGHYCFLTTTPSCCSCSDQRSHSENNQYDTYVDGYGIQKLAKRNQHYCPSCKQCEN